MPARPRPTRSPAMARSWSHVTSVSSGESSERAKLDGWRRTREARVPPLDHPPIAPGLGSSRIVHREHSWRLPSPSWSGVPIGERLPARLAPPRMKADRLRACRRHPRERRRDRIPARSSPTSRWPMSRSRRSTALFGDQLRDRALALDLRVGPTWSPASLRRRATGFPRSVTTISSPRRTMSSHFLRWSRSCRTPTTMSAWYTSLTHDDHAALAARGSGQPARSCGPAGATSAG